MRRPPAEPSEPVEPAPPLSQTIKGRHAPWTTPDPEPIHHFLFDTARITLYNK